MTDSVIWLLDGSEHHVTTDADYGKRHGVEYVNAHDPFALAKALRDLGYIVSRIVTKDGRVDPDPRVAKAAPDE